jgi:hypothetical protein
MFFMIYRSWAPSAASLHGQRISLAGPGNRPGSGAATRPGASVQFSFLIFVLALKLRDFYAPAAGTGAGADAPA